VLVRIRKYVKPLVAVNLLLAVLLLGLLARTAPVTRRDLHIDRLAQQVRFPVATDVFLALTGAASEVVGIAALLVGVVALLVRRRRWDAARLAAMAGTSWVLAIGVKSLVGRPRPPASLWALTPDSSGSFPSGHDTTACVVIVVALMAFQGARRARAFAVAAAVVFAIAVGVSRVYLGDHYPTDVIGSWLVVAAATTSVWAMCDLPAVRRLARAVLRDPRLELEPTFA
jgi:membrane-associated phospholipid phosphatase